MPTEAAGISTERILWWHDRILSGLACSLCVTAQIKFAQVQLLEFIYAVDIVLVCLFLLLRPQPIRLFRPFLRLAVHWTLFALGCLVLAFVSLRQNFYLSPAVGGLSSPIMVTLARLFELVLDVFALVYLACRFREDESLCRYALRFYCAIGIAGCVWGWFIVFNFALHGAYGRYRMSGFNNEGGPFGIYLVTVIAAFLALRQKGWMTRKSFVLSMPVLLISLIAAKSKAAFLEIAVFVLVIAMLKMKPIKALAIGATVSAVVVILFQVLGLAGPTLGYLRLSERYAYVSRLRPKDGNYVIGRVAGLYLTPKMIAAHPFAGIGLGNYPLVRDDPQYRRGGVVVAVASDSPSLGFIDYLVEIGFPLFLYLTYIQVVPAVDLLRKGASTGAVALVLTMPISLWFGAHLNMTYPWIAGAMALALFYSNHDAEGEPFPSALTGSARNQEIAVR